MSLFGAKEEPLRPQRPTTHRHSQTRSHTGGILLFLISSKAKKKRKKNNKIICSIAQRMNDCQVNSVDLFIFSWDFRWICFSFGTCWNTCSTNRFYCTAFLWRLDKQMNPSNLELIWFCRLPAVLTVLWRGFIYKMLIHLQRHQLHLNRHLWAIIINS